MHARMPGRVLELSARARTLSPMVPAAATALSPVSVIGNALRLRGVRLG